MTASSDLIAAIGPRVRTSAFFDRTVSAGLTAVSVYNHMWLPMSYGDPDGEYERLTTGVTMWDVAAQRHTEVSGPDADAAVQMLTMVDTSQTPIGRAIYAPMVDDDGRLLNDPVLFHVGADAWRFSISDSDVRPWMQANVTHRRLDCRVRELDTVTLAVQGPRADEVVEALGLDQVAVLAQFEHTAAVIDGDIEVLVSRSGWSEQGGVEILLDDVTRAERLWDVVAEAGAASNIGPAAPNPSERIENFLLSYGTDTGYDADPFELGLGDLIDFDTGDFIGRTALLRLRERGVSRRLVGMKLDGDRMEPLSRPHRICVDDADVGQLRAGAWSPRFATNLGISMMDASVELGSTVDVVGHGVVGSGIAVDLPFDE